MPNLVVLIAATKAPATSFQPTACRSPICLLNVSKVTRANARFKSTSTYCMMETSYLLAGKRSHEHWRPIRVGVRI